jgi:glycosyltransferase involved in cell wall biosynthesis
MHLLRGLESLGHRCSVWLDGGGRASDFASWFGAPSAGVHETLAGWRGADAALATGWQTAHRVARLDGCAARAYLVQDHEPEFHGTSAERVWAEDTYRLGLPAIAASPWLAALLRERYDADAWSFDLGVDHAVYAPRPGVPRRPATVAAYARAATPRRAVPLVVLALTELHARRPEADIVLFGEARELAVPFPARQTGVLDGPGLAALYAEATAGVVVSMTNPSLVATEMLACGLPVVDVDSEAMRATFGADGPIELAAFDPVALAAATERVLDDAALRAERAAAGVALAAGRTWPAAARQVETALRQILAEQR